jgi:hypothetical protein
MQWDEIRQKRDASVQRDENCAPKIPAFKI